MKKVLNIGSKIVAMVVVMLTATVSAFASGNTTENSSLNPAAVIGFTALLIAAIIIPAAKSPRKPANQYK